MEWMNNKIDEAENGILIFWIDKTHSMNSCSRSRSRQRNQQMSIIQLFVIILPLRKKKKKQEFKVMEDLEEDEDYALSLDYLDRLHVMRLFGRCLSYFLHDITPT